MKISVHIHSEYSSDARQSARSILERCRRFGYDTIAITDHNTVRGSLAAIEVCPEGMTVIPGAEFSTEKGHVLALFIDEAIEKTCPKSGRVYQLDALVQMVRAQGGLLFLAHPYESAAIHDHAFIEALDGFEYINGRLNSGYRNAHARALCDELRLAYPGKLVIGGSDAHNSFELGGVFMTSECTDARSAFQRIDDIHFRPPSAARIRLMNIFNNKGHSLRFYFRQAVLTAVGLYYDLGRVVKGQRCEIIRVRAQD